MLEGTENIQLLKPTESKKACDIKSLTNVLISMCTLEKPQNFEEVDHHPISAIYSIELSKFIDYLKRLPQRNVCDMATTILNHNLIKESKAKKKEEIRHFGQPLEKYSELYKEIKELGTGSFG
jgi:hypothetical protein